MRHLQDVIAGIAGGGDREARLAMRGHRRHPAGEIVVVEQLPGIVERTPADALDGECDRCADRPALGRNIDRHVDRIGDLRQQAGALLQHDIVLKAEIIRRRKACGEAPLGIALHFAHQIIGGNEFAALIFGLRDFPAAIDGAPDQLEFLVGRKFFALDRERRAGLAVFGHDIERADIAALALADFHFRSECRSGGCRGGTAPRKRQQSEPPSQSVQPPAVDRHETLRIISNDEFTSARPASAYPPPPSTAWCRG